MLYSAEAVMLPPSLRAPPIATTWPRCEAKRGSSARAAARLVIGPVTARATLPAGRLITAWTRKSTAWPAAAGAAGSNTAMSPRPEAPWNASASTGRRTSGLWQPA